MHSLHYVLKVNIDNFFHLGEIYLCIACDKKTNRKKTVFSNCYSKSEKNTDTQNYIEEKKSKCLIFYHFTNEDRLKKEKKKRTWMMDILPNGETRCSREK
jgi:hypothetical protein